MTWVRECLELQRKQQPVPSTTPAPKPVTKSKGIWDRIGDAIDADVHEFNMARGRQFDVTHMEHSIIQLIPKQAPMDTLTVQLESGIIKLKCAISHPGVPRQATFKIREGNIVWSGDFAGTPKPRETPMNPQQFSEEILKPFLFPDLK
jgi:hypothetical protein